MLPYSCLFSTICEFVANIIYLYSFLLVPVALAISCCVIVVADIIHVINDDDDDNNLRINYSLHVVSQLV